MQVNFVCPRMRVLTVAGTTILGAGIFASIASAQVVTPTDAPAQSSDSQISVTVVGGSTATDTPPKPVAAPRNALAVSPGETRLDGLPVGSLDSTSGKFNMNVCSYVAGHAGRIWLESPRSKPVEIDRNTLLYSFGSTSSQIVLSEAQSQPYHVTAIGWDRGDGQPLVARVVWIQRGTPLEARFVKEAKPARHESSTRPDVLVERPLVYTMGHYFPACVVEAKLSTVQVRVGLAWRHVGATESLGGIVKDYGAIAGINGSFFDAYNHSAIKLPNNELICMSEPVNCSDIGTVLGFTPDGQARMERSPVVDALHRLDPTNGYTGSDPDKALFWQRVTEGMGAGPRLVKDGEIDYNPYSEGFHSAEVLDGVNLRSAVGITNNGELMLVTTKATMRQLAHIMKALGCSQAMNLDGGASSGLWAKGHYLRSPGRQLSNALLILRK